MDGTLRDDGGNKDEGDGQADARATNGKQLGGRSSHDGGRGGKEKGEKEEKKKKKKDKKRKKGD